MIVSDNALEFNVYKYMTEDIDKNQYYFVTKLQKKVDENTGCMSFYSIRILSCNPACSIIAMSNDKELGYQEMNFFSTRTFANIFFEQKTELKNRLDFFLNNKEWYQVR
jgi:hypothetical protein